MENVLSSVRAAVNHSRNVVHSPTSRSSQASAGEVGARTLRIPIPARWPLPRPSRRLRRSSRVSRHGGDVATAARLADGSIRDRAAVSAGRRQTAPIGLNRPRGTRCERGPRPERGSPGDRRCQGWQSAVQNGGFAYASLSARLGVRDEDAPAARASPNRSRAPQRSSNPPLSHHKDLGLKNEGIEQDEAPMVDRRRGCDAVRLSSKVAPNVSCTCSRAPQ